MNIYEQIIKNMAFFEQQKKKIESSDSKLKQDKKQKTKALHKFRSQSPAR
jgi:hypothetical protein